MPIIPRARPRSNILGVVPRSRAPSPADFFAGSDEGSLAAIGRFASELSSIGQDMLQAQRAAKLTSAQAQATAKIQEIAFGLNNGQLNPDGSVTPPPDPSQAFGIYQARVGEIMEQAREGLDDASFSVFESNVSKVALRESFGVRKQALDRHKAEVLSLTQDTVDTLAHAAAYAHPTAAPRVMNQMRLAVQDQVERGVISPQRGRELIQGGEKSASVATLRRITRENPKAVVRMLQGGQIDLPGIGPEEQELWIDRALKAVKRQRKERLAEISMSEARAAQGRRMTKHAAHQQLADLAATGELTPEKLREFAPFITGPVYERYRKGLRGRSSRIVHSSIVQRIDELRKRPMGSDLDTDALEVKDIIIASQEDLSASDVRILLGDVDKARQEMPDWYKDGSDHIKQVVRGGRSPEREQSERALATTEFARWAEQNRDATPDDARSFYRRAARKHAVQLTGLGSLQDPSGLPGFRNKTGSNEERLEILKAYAKDLGTRMQKRDPQAWDVWRNEGENLNEWRIALEALVDLEANSGR